MTTSELLIEVVGWAGALMILAAYALVSTGRVAPTGVPYQALNIVGAAGFVINGYAHGALPSAVLNVIWIGIGVFVLMWRKKPA